MRTPSLHHGLKIYTWRRTHNKAEYMHMHIPSHIIMAFIVFHAAYVMRSRSFPPGVGVSIPAPGAAVNPVFVKKHRPNIFPYFLSSSVQSRRDPESSPSRFMRVSSRAMAARSTPRNSARSLCGRGRRRTGPPCR